MTADDANVRPDPRSRDEAREARYAEAMHRATCRHRGGQPGTCPVDGGLAFYRWAEAVMAVADAEQAELWAEVERLLRQEAGQTRSAQRAWHTARFFREHLHDAEARVAELEAALQLEADYADAADFPKVADRLRAIASSTSPAEQCSDS